MSELLPLFPLEVVLFPGMPLPLHIFEPRYKEMIGLCLQHRQEFGVVLTLKEGIASVGCSAAIVQVVKRYDDGRLDILTGGRRRFRVLQVFEDLPYLQGTVEILPEVAAEQESTASPRLQSLYEATYQRVHSRSPTALETGSGFLPSYQIATELPLPAAYKQHLLETVSERERQQDLADQLDDWLRRQRQTDRVKKVARGNGRGRPA